VLPCLLVALGLSIVGVLRDQRRLLALVALSISATLTLFTLLAGDVVTFIMTMLGC